MLAALSLYSIFEKETLCNHRKKLLVRVFLICSDKFVLISVKSGTLYSMLWIVTRITLLCLSMNLFLFIFKHLFLFCSYILLFSSLFSSVPLFMLLYLVFLIFSLLFSISLSSVAFLLRLEIFTYEMKYFIYAIGGLAGGEDKDSFWKVVAHVRTYAVKCLLILKLLFPLNIWYRH